MRLILFISLLLILSCRSNSRRTSNAEEPILKDEKTSIESDFWLFHSRFLTDTAFQKNCFTELNTKPDPDFTKIQAIYSLFRERSVRGMPAYDTVFAGYSISVKGDSVIERIFNDGGPGTSQRVFKKVNRKWYLSSYERPIWHYSFNHE